MSHDVYDKVLRNCACHSYSNKPNTRLRNYDMPDLWHGTLWLRTKQTLIFAILKVREAVWRS
jgi:hypothetical protein